MITSEEAFLAISEFQTLETQLIDCLSYIPFIDQNKTAVSPRFIPIIVQSCSLIDSVFNRLSDRRGKHNNLKYYYDNFECRMELADNYSLFLYEPLTPLNPFKDWKNGQPNWWFAYNRFKHDRLSSYTEAKFSYAISALCGLHQVMSRCKEFFGAFLQANWIDTTKIEASAELASVAYLGGLHPSPPSIAVESRLFLSGSRESVLELKGSNFEVDFEMNGISIRISNLVLASEGF